jgi:Flp pilus assembly protein TadG
MRSRLSAARRALAAFSRGRRRLASDERGVTAVEFGLVSVPFLGITFAIVEMSILLFSGQALDTALQDTSRRIMTGQIQVAGLSQTQFKNEICTRMPSLINCAADVFVDVRSYPDAAPAPALPVNSGNFDTSNFIFKPGGPSCIVVVRAALRYRVYTSLWGNGLANLNDGTRVLMSTVSFRNEPYNIGSPPPCEAT